VKLAACKAGYLGGVMKAGNQLKWQSGLESGERNVFRKWRLSTANAISYSAANALARNGDNGS